MVAKKGAEQQLVSPNQYLQQLCHLVFLPLKLAVGLKFSYNTAISLLGNFWGFLKYVKNQPVKIRPKMHQQGVA